MTEKETAAVREAARAEMPAVYLMGFDVWGEGKPEASYLEQCGASPKYRTERWYVLADGQGAPLSSLVVYQLGPGVAGIGSIATPPGLRRRGLAARLIKDILELLAREGAKTVFLFSDIAPGYYEQFGFRILPAEFQRYPGSTCMAWGGPVSELLSSPGFSLPTYF